MPLARPVVHAWAALVFLESAAALGRGDDPLQATVTIEADHVVRGVPRFWLGQNVEWVWNGQGLFREDGSGAKPGVVELLRDLKPGLIRYPGGSLANTFRWANSIGPLAQRQPITNFFEKTGERPLLGFDDFMQFVDQVDARGAILIVNCNAWPNEPENSGSPQEAAAWVAYANARVGDPPVVIGVDSRGTDWRNSQHWAHVRAAHGHPEPYDVMHWEIGNEIYAADQGAGLTPESYADRVIEYSRLMKGVDGRIRIGVIDWREGKWATAPRLVASARGAADFRIRHDYVDGGAGLFRYTTGFRDTGDRTYVFSTEAGRHTLAVTAWSRPLAGIGPQMQVELDDVELGTETVKAVSDEKGESADTFTYDLDLTAGEHTLDLRFLNPEPEEGVPYRDLYLKSITLQPAGGEARSIPIKSLDLLMAANAGCVEKLAPSPVPNAEPTPGVIPYHRTEYGCINHEDNFRHNSDQKSAVFAARLAQASLLDPDCEGANYWCLRSGPFRVLETSPDGGFRYAPSGIVFRMLAPLAEGDVVMTRYDGPSLMGSWVGFARKRGWGSAVAVRTDKQIAVNLLSYHPSRPLRVTLNFEGVDLRFDEARKLTMVGPGPEAMNADGKSPVITLQQGRIDAGPTTTIVLEPCSVTTVVMTFEQRGSGKE